MLMLLWVLAAAVVGLLLLTVVVRGRGKRSSPVEEVGRFQAAREVTNRWSGDPGSTPQPLRDYLREQQSPPAAADEGGQV